MLVDNLVVLRACYKCNDIVLHQAYTTDKPGIFILKCVKCGNEVNKEYGQFTLVTPDGKVIEG